MTVILVLTNKHKSLTVFNLTVIMILTSKHDFNSFSLMAFDNFLVAKTLLNRTTLRTHQLYADTTLFNFSGNELKYRNEDLEQEYRMETFLRI